MILELTKAYMACPSQPVYYIMWPSPIDGGILSQFSESSPPEMGHPTVHIIHIQWGQQNWPIGRGEAGKLSQGN